jgi:hypothetical protein
MRTRSRRATCGPALRILGIGALLTVSSAGAGPEGPLVLESPLEGAVVGPTVKVRGRVSAAPEAQGVLRVNGGDVPLVEGRFEAELRPTVEGAFAIRAQFAVLGLPATTVARTVVVDLTPPMLEILEPPTEVSTHAVREVVIHGEVTDRHLREVRMNGQAVRVDAKGVFRETFLLPADQEVKVLVEAVDAAGNRTEAVRALRASAASRDAAAAEGSEPARRPQVRPPPPTAFLPEILLDVSSATGRVHLRHDRGEHVGDEDFRHFTDRDNAIASLRAALRHVPWFASAPGVQPDRPARPLVLRYDEEGPWDHCAALLRLAGQPGLPGVLLLRVRNAPDAEAPVSPDGSGGGNASPITVTITIGGRVEGEPPGTSSTRCDGLGAPIHIVHDAGDRIVRRSDALHRLRRAVAERRALSPRSSGRVVMDYEGFVTFGDVVTVCQAFALAGAPVTVAAGTKEWPIEFGESRPMERVPPPAPAPKVSAEAGPATPAPLPTPPAAVDALAFAFRADRDRARALGFTEPVEQSVVAALRWLAAHVAPDGGWEAAGFSQRCTGAAPAVAPPDGAGMAAHDVGVTGLALSAFLAAGYGPRGDHEFARVVRRGVAWLRAQQDEEGCFGYRADEHFVYDHAAATAAMVEAYGMSGSRALGDSAQRALDFAASARNPDGVWRYGVRTGENDTSVTSWMALALRSAQLVNAACAERGKAPPLAWDLHAPSAWMVWLRQVSQRNGEVRYTPGTWGPSRPTDRRYSPAWKVEVQRFPRDKVEGPAAAAALLRLFAGEKTASLAVEQGIARCLRVPPVWKDDGSIDFDYWYFGSLATFQVGAGPWKSWSAAMGRVLPKNQRQDGGVCGYAGSWDPLDAWGSTGGRVYSTAMGALILATPNRYERISPSK